MRSRTATISVLLIGLSGGVAAAQREGVAPESRRECAVCHLSWVESFEPGRARGPLLIDQPPFDSVSDAEMCLGCHDGSVADSRRRVWLDRSHKTGIAPPSTMKVPEILPLTDGKLACRTCHTAHSGRGPENLANTIFVRVPNDASQLCQLCHPDKAKGPELGTHPVGGMPFPVPQAVIDAGGRIGPEKSRLICQTCHTAHGAPQERLLVMGTESSELCMTCHSKLRPGLWRPGAPREHPLNPPLSTPAQREAIRQMGTEVGPGDKLICLSCHKLHHGLAGRYMLADRLVDSDLCVRCHPERKEMFGTLHDLRKSAPDERNRLGQTATESGPCGACHSFHQFARRPAREKLDPTGLCATCHRSDGCAAKATGMPFSHPDEVAPTDLPPGARLQLYPQLTDPSKKGLACLTCHNPHRAQETAFLRMGHDAVCGQCHSRQIPTLTSDHDFTGHPEWKNARDKTASQAGKCGFCHAVHDANGPMMWIATTAAPSTPDGLCTGCHRADGLAAKKVGGKLLHPEGPSTAASVKSLNVELPLFGENCGKSKQGFVACATCHNPHAGREGPPEMLRGGAAPEPNSMCMQCHPGASYLNTSLHSPPLLKSYAGAKRVCGPCHAVHAGPDVQATGMWAGPLGPAAQRAIVRECTGCHSPGGGAPVVRLVEHPAVLMQNLGPPGDLGFMPLVDEKGKLGPAGMIACVTCHMPHGRSPDALSPAINLAEIDLPDLRAVMPMLRPYRSPNLCGQCHGFDGLRRFLYYHYPEKRTGPAGVQPLPGSPGVPPAPGRNSPRSSGASGRDVGAAAGDKK